MSVKNYSSIEAKSGYTIFFKNLSRWQKITTFVLLSGLIMAGLVFGFQIINQNNKTANASSLDTGFYQVNQVLISPDDQVLYVRGGGNGGSPVGVKKVDANANTDLGVSVNYANNSGFDMVLSQDGSKLYVVLFNSVEILNTSDFSLIASISVDSSPNGARAVLNSDESKLYVGGTNTINVINTANNSVSTTITDPKITLTQIPSSDSKHNMNNMVFSPDGTKLYLAGGKYIDTATDTLNSQDLLSGASPSGYNIILNKDGTKMYISGSTGTNTSATSQAFGNQTKVIDLNNGTLEKLLPFGLNFLSPDGSKLYIIKDEGAGISPTPNRTRVYVYDTRNNLEIAVSSYLPDTIETAIMSKDGSTIYTSGYRYSGATRIKTTPIIDVNSLVYSNSVDENTVFSAEPKILSDNGKSIFYIKGRVTSFIFGVPDTEASVIKQDTSLLSPTDISSFNCTAPTNTLGSTVTCTVNTNTTRYGLAKFNLGLESCTSYFPATGANTASCAYIANNIQSSTITVTPSYGLPSTSTNSLTITGGANDVTIGASNIVSNNCSVSGNIKISAVFDCNFSLTGSSSNTYILPTNGIKIGVNTVLNKSDNCRLDQNGTTNVKLVCKSIPTLGGTTGTQNILAYINGSSTGNNVGNTNLTDGFLVNSITDTVDALPGDDYCGDSTGQCSLRAAVMEANSDYIKNKITIPAGIYQLTIVPTNYSVGAVDGDLDITTDIDFVGADKTTTFIQAGTSVDSVTGIPDSTGGIADRVFHIFNTNVNMSGLTVRYGKVMNDNIGQLTSPSLPAFDKPRPGNGGGLNFQSLNDFGLNSENSLIPQTGILDYDTANLVSNGIRKDFNLTDVDILDNYAQNSGGGVYNASQYSTFTNVDIKNNGSGKYGVD